MLLTCFSFLAPVDALPYCTFRTLLGASVNVRLKVGLLSHRAGERMSQI